MRELFWNDEGGHYPALTLPGAARRPVRRIVAVTCHLTHGSVDDGCPSFVPKSSFDKIRG